MKIIRNILGENIEIELTSDEIYQAYLKYEEACDIQDVQTYIDKHDNSKFFEKYNVTIDRINNDTDICDFLFNSMMEMLDQYEQLCNLKR